MVEGRHGVSIDFRKLCESLSKESVKSISDSIISDVKASSKPAIAEISGTDSVAAIIKASRTHGFDCIIPVVVSTGTEYGSPDFIKKNVKVAGDRIEGRILDVILLADLDFWKALNGRFIQIMADRYGFYSPCPGCHLYLHAMRIPLALKLGVKYVISGERESHDGRIKINQLPAAINCYKKLMARWNIEMVLPLQHVTDSSEIMQLVDGLCGREDQFNCLFSGNYRDLNGGVIVGQDLIRTFYTEFGLPVTTTILEKIIENPNTKLEAFMKDYLK